MAEYIIDHLSASQIVLYILCSLKYRFQYVDKLPRPFKASGLAFGSVMHSALDWFHKQRKQKRDVSLDDLCKILRADWFCQKCEDEIRYKDGEDEQKLILTARGMLSLYYHSPLNGVMESEFSFRVPLVNPNTGEALPVPLEGYIDLIETNEVVTEFKNTAKAINPDSLADMLQLIIYSYAYRMVFGKEAKTLKVINFVKTRTPKMNVLESPTRKKEDYVWLFHLVSEVLKGIRMGVYFPKKSFLCGDCEYEVPCGAWRGNGEIGLPAADYRDNKISAHV
jgi:putative RecB family exonuclease